MSFSWTIKAWNELTPQELYDCIKLRLAVFSVEQNCPYQDCDDLDQQAIHFLYYQAEKLVGYLRVFESLEKYQGDSAIGRVCCALDKRGSGLGVKLMQKAIDYLDQHFDKAIQISAQAYLEDFYKQFGFVVNSQLYLEDGIEHIKMIRQKGNG